MRLTFLADRCRVSQNVPFAGPPSIGPFIAFHRDGNPTKTAVRKAGLTNRVTKWSGWSAGQRYTELGRHAV